MIQLLNDGWVIAYVVIIIPSRCKQQWVNNFVIFNCSSLMRSEQIDALDVYITQAKFRRHCFISREGDRLSLRLCSSEYRDKIIKLIYPSPILQPNRIKAN